MTSRSDAGDLGTPSPASNRGVVPDLVAEGIELEGFALLSASFSRSFIEAVARSTVTDVVTSRPIVDVGEFRETLASSGLISIAERILGPDLILGRLEAGGATNAELAELARACTLFGDPRLDGKTPVVSLACLAPLEDATLRLWRGSHRSIGAGDEVLVTLERRSCLMFDARLRVEFEQPPVRSLVAVFHRHWFREPIRPDRSPRVSMSSRVFRSLSTDERRLVSWRLERYRFHRARRALHRFVSRLPGPVVSFVARVILRR